MKIRVIAPSEQYLAAAEVRIRYQRIAKHLATLGHELRIAVVDTLNKASALTDDVYLISKCYDARALVAARLLADNGKIIGADFFDDYFSQAGDSRFVRQREWVRDLAGFLDFFLCSTPRMREVIAGYLGDRAGHIMNDPFNSFDIDATRARLETNLDNALTRRRIDVLWFGVGDNPHFSVGLDDLSGYGHVLGDLAGGGFDVRLSILTNARALTVDGLERLRRLPVPYRVEEWTEEKETDHLARSLVAFLPVNAQPFSAAKSLNRAVSALTGGVQVLSPGYPLYAPLGRFVYDDAGRLRQDVEAGTLALRGETLPGLMDLFTTWGDPQREADKLAAFLETVQTAKRPVAPPQTPTVVGVVNGKRGRRGGPQVRPAHRPPVDRQSLLRRQPQLRRRVRARRGRGPGHPAVADRRQAPEPQARGAGPARPPAQRQTRQAGVADRPGRRCDDLQAAGPAAQLQKPGPGQLRGDNEDPVGRPWPGLA